MSEQRRIKIVSTLLQLACAAYLIGAPLLWLLLWLNFETLGPQWSTLANMPLLPEYIGLWNKLLGALITAIPIVLMMRGVLHLQKLFAQFRQGKLFSESGASHLHVFAWMLFITMLLTPFIGALLSVVLTMNNPEDQRAVVFTLGSNNLNQLFMAGTLFAITWTLREGYRLRQENEAFV